MADFRQLLPNQQHTFDQVEPTVEPVVTAGTERSVSVCGGVVFSDDGVLCVCSGGVATSLKLISAPVQDVPVWKRALEPVYRFSIGGLAGGKDIRGTL